MAATTALIMSLVWRSRVRAGHTRRSSGRALSKLRLIQHHRISLNETPSAEGLSSTSNEQAVILAALAIKKPSPHTQLALL